MDQLRPTLNLTLQAQKYYRLFTKPDQSKTTDDVEVFQIQLSLSHISMNRTLRDSFTWQTIQNALKIQHACMTYFDILNFSSARITWASWQNRRFAWL